MFSALTPAQRFVLDSMQAVFAKAHVFIHKKCVRTESASIMGLLGVALQSGLSVRSDIKCRQIRDTHL
jgi:hypothetical protein